MTYPPQLTQKEQLGVIDSKFHFVSRRLTVSLAPDYTAQPRPEEIHVIERLGGPEVSLYENVR